MRNGVKNALFAVGGAVFGSLVTWILVRGYYQKKAEEEIELVEKAFTDRINEIEDEKAEALNVAEKAILSANDYSGDPGASSLIKNRSTLDGMIKAGKAERVDYTEYYRDRGPSGIIFENTEKNSAESIAVDDHPHDDGEEGDSLEGDAADFGADERDHGIFEIGNGMEGLRDPYEIDYREYGSIPSYEFKELYYYQGDGTLVEAEGDVEDIIDNPEYIVGNVLIKSGFNKDDRKTIWLRNEHISCDYEIMKVFGTYGDM